jgi:hypothetical protein
MKTYLLILNGLIQDVMNVNSKITLPYFTKLSNATKIWGFTEHTHYISIKYFNPLRTDFLGEYFRKYIFPQQMGESEN